MSWLTDLLARFFAWISPQHSEYLRRRIHRHKWELRTGDTTKIVCAKCGYEADVFFERPE